MPKVTAAEITVDSSNEFYRNLFERKLSKLESLRQAQLWMLNHPEAIAGRDLITRG